MDNNNLILRCNGFILNGFLIPSFDVSEGDVICLHLDKHIPLTFPSEFTDTVKQTLNDERFIFRKTNPDRIQCVNSYEGKKRFSLMPDKTTVQNKINKALGCFDDTCVEFLRIYNIKADELYCKNGHTEKMLLRLFIAIRHNDLIITNSFGLDPQGFEKVMDFVKLNTTGKGIIYFSSEHTDGTRYCFKVNQCYNVLQST